MNGELILNANPQLLYVGRMKPDPKWQMKNHSHACCELVYIVEGSGFVRSGKTVFPCAAGDLLIYNRGFLHEEWTEEKEPLRSYYCAIGNLSVKGFSNGCLIRPDESPVIHTGKEREAILYAMKTLDYECKMKQAGYQTIAFGTLLNLIVMAARLASNRDNHGIDVGNGVEWKIKAFLDSHYASVKSMDEIADQLHISPYYLAHAFKNDTGQSPMNYLIHKRMKKAIEFLQTGNYKIYEIAEMVGYADPNYFSTAFKKVTGVSPSRFNSSLNGKDDISCTI